MSDTPTLTARREFVFLYDIKMGNPNGDPDAGHGLTAGPQTRQAADVMLLAPQAGDDTGAFGLTVQLAEHRADPLDALY